MSTRIFELRTGRPTYDVARHPSERWGIPVGACRDPKGEVPAFAGMTVGGVDVGPGKALYRLLCLGLLSLSLAACGSGKPSTTQVAAEQAKESAGDLRIPCARGTAALETVCTIEQTRSETGSILTIRHPDGGFRRLLVTDDGRGVTAADGAEVVAVTVMDADGIEVALGGNRYRLPATVKGASKPS